MASSKLKISRKAIIQIVLLLTGSMILFLTYFVDLKKKDLVSEKIEEVKVSEEKDQLKKQLTHLKMLNTKVSILTVIDL